MNNNNGMGNQARMLVRLLHELGLQYLYNFGILVVLFIMISG